MIGFIGLGVMGAPMCRNLAARSGLPVLGFDRDPAALARLAAQGVTACASPAAVAAADTVFLCLPSGNHVSALAEDLLPHARPGQLVVDLGTSPVALARQLGTAFAAAGTQFADAPIARTRQAAEDGTLSIMVGADPAVFARLQPLLACIATDVTHCGPVGSGQLAKIMNNMVLVQTVIALSEAIAIAAREGMAAGPLLDVLSKGSADSFALRNHGLKAIVPGAFPERAFSVRYARKDISYAIELARAHGLDLPGVDRADAALGMAEAAGDGDRYWPVVSRVIGR